ncbi:MAG: hypothetical protein NVS9B11_22630 [Candidatus Dormibacteraceae bacterium]
MLMEVFVRTSTKWLLVTLGVGVPAVPLSFVLWPAPESVPTPPDSMLPLFFPIGILIPALSFGLGVAFLFFGKRFVRANDDGWLSRACYLSVAWLFLQWWPHSNLHRVAGLDWSKVLFIDWSFHATIILATVLVGAFVLRVWRVQEIGHPATQR